MTTPKNKRRTAFSARGLAADLAGNQGPWQLRQEQGAAGQGADVQGSYEGIVHLSAVGRRSAPRRRWRRAPGRRCRGRQEAYRKALIRRHGSVLKPRAYAVVAIGFARLVVRPVL